MIVDNQPLMCDALTRIINKESDLVVCGQARDAAGAMETLEVLQPDIIILDLSLPDTSGFDLLQSIKTDLPHIPALVFSMYDESTHAPRAIRAGAKGYLMKTQTAETVIEAVRHILDGKIWVNKDIMSGVLDGCLGSESDPYGVRRQLSKRELEIFELIGKGISTEEIAKKLFISRRTVDSHRDHIKSKLKIQDVLKLHQLAFQWTHDQFVP